MKTNTKSLLARITAIILTVAVLLVSIPFAVITASAAGPVADSYVIWEANPDKISMEDNAVVTPSSYWFDWTRQSPDEISDVSYYSTEYSSTTNVKTFFKSGYSNDQAPWLYNGQQLVGKYGKLKFDLRTSTTITVGLGYSNYANAQFAGYLGVATNTVANEWVSHEIDLIDISYDINWWYGYVSVEVSNLGDTIDENNHLFMDIRNMRIEISEKDRAAINDDAAAAERSDLAFDSLIAFDRTYSIYTATPIVTDDVSFRATCVNTKGDTQDIRFIATFKHLLSHFAVGLNIKATLEDGTVKEWREFTQNVYETLKNYGDDFTPYSISGNNDGYAYAVTVEGVPTNMGNIAFEVTPFLSDGKDGITNGETETVYYYNGILENTMLKHANNTEDNFDVSFEADHPGVVNMDAKYTLVVKDENGIAVANPTIEVSNSAVTVNDLDITVPYSVRSSDEKLIITISKDGKSTAYWVDFPKFTAAPTFNDDFDSLNTDVWSPFVGDTENTNLITTVTDGDKNVLSMNDTVAGSPPSISSSGNFAQSYGCFSANIRMPTTGNGNAAFWLYSEVAYTFKNADGTIGKALSAYIPNLEDTTGNNSYGEIDVVERSAKWNYGGYATSLHWGGQGDVNGTLTSANKVSAYAYGSDASVYQTYSVVWTDTMICWYLDGELVFKYYPEMPEDGTVDYRNNGMGVGPDSGKMFLILQNTHGTVNGWCGPYDEADFPATMYVDWVQVYGLN